MGRSWVAAAVLFAALSLPGCGPSAQELEPGLRADVEEFAKAVVAKNDEKINMYLLPRAGQRDNPVGAKDMDNPEGRKKIVEGNRRWARKTFLDAGIKEPNDVPAFMKALRITISGINARVSFEIAAEGRRAAELVTLQLQKTDQGWRIFDYDRDMKTR